MPHKHKRSAHSRRSDDSSHDLPPNSVARPIPVGKVQQNGSNSTKPRSQKRKTAMTVADDTPKEFLRLMAFQNKCKRPKTDDEQPGNKKRRTSEHSEGHARSESKSQETQAHELKRVPGERLADFAARVDQAIPITGLARKGKKQTHKVLKERQTRIEKKQQKMQAAWRKEDARLKEKEQELRDEQEERDALEGVDLDNIRFGTEGKTRGKRKRKRGGATKENDDPWAVLEEKRQRPTSVHDVAQAPPQLKPTLKAKFKVRDGARVDVANVPVASGSLRRREELGDIRRSVIESYRRRMGEQQKQE